MPFHHTYTVRLGDNVTNIGQRFGFSNPGPIVSYPLNSSRFRNRSPHLIHPDEKLLVPWRRDHLQKYIATCRHLTIEIARSAKALIDEQMKSKKEIDQFLYKIDAINFLANIGVGIGALTVQGAKGVEMSSKEALIWLLESRATVASNIATLAIPAPQAPRKDFKFFIRHTLGPWNPSFWASVYAAVEEGDIDLYLYGSDAVAYKASLKIKQQAETDIRRLRRKIEEAERQVSEPFYNHILR